MSDAGIIFSCRNLVDNLLNHGGPLMSHIILDSRHLGSRDAPLRSNWQSRAVVCGWDRSWREEEQLKERSGRMFSLIYE